MIIQTLEKYRQKFYQRSHLLRDDPEISEIFLKEFSRKGLESTEEQCKHKITIRTRPSSGCDDMEIHFNVRQL